MTCYFSVKLVAFQMPDAILRLNYSAVIRDYLQLYASISRRRLEMTGICQAQNEMQMTGSRLTDASQRANAVRDSVLFLQGFCDPYPIW